MGSCQLSTKGNLCTKYFCSKCYFYRHTLFYGVTFARGNFEEVSSLHEDTFAQKDFFLLLLGFLFLLPLLPLTLTLNQ